MTDIDTVNIRDIQHYLYCPHRWGLLNIDCAWAENAYVVKANLLHSRVHDAKESYISRCKKVFTAVRVYNDEYGIFGVTDCIEARKSDNGVLIDGEKYALTIVEYKPTQRADGGYNEDDALQVYAQKLCVDFVFQTESTAEIYYANTRKKVELPFNVSSEKYDVLLRDTLSQMREYARKGEIPQIVKGQKCSGCSMKDLCMPKRGARGSVRSSIQKILEEAEP